MHKLNTIALCGLIILVLAQAALAASPEERIRTLEHQLAEMQKTYMRNNQGTASAIAKSEGMHGDINTLKGKIESNQHMIKSQYDDLTKLINELDHRIQAIEDRMSIFSTQLSKALGTVAPKAAAEGNLYQKGLDLVNRSKYLEAAAAFNKFRNKYPKSPFTASALAWVGECYYSMRDYHQAIKEYQRFVEKYPRDKNVRTAMLKQGNSFYELGMLDEASAFYDEVIRKYPSSSAASMAREKKKRIRERKSKSFGSQTSPSSVGSYPTETIQQQHDRMRGRKTQKSTQNKKPEKKRKTYPVRDF